MKKRTIELFFQEEGAVTEKAISDLEKAVLDMDEKLATQAAKSVLDSKIDVLKAINEGLVKGMKKVADLYEREQIFLPQVLASANAFYAAFEILRPKMLEGAKGVGHKIVIGVVEGDIHDIGKNLVKTMMEANGYHCIDLGRDVPVENFVEAVTDQKPSFVAMSTLMTPTMKNMKRVIDGLVEENVRNSVKIMIGGGPVDQEFAKEIGADYYGENETEAVKWLRSVS
ncbi:MAG: corrinoid protein [Methanomassiliicoccales archaeon]|nr:corrinoid protein [Methanomassiliicoccales archaeon]